MHCTELITEFAVQYFQRVENYSCLKTGICLPDGVILLNIVWGEGCVHW